MNATTLPILDLARYADPGLIRRVISKQWHNKRHITNRGLIT